MWLLVRAHGRGLQRRTLASCPDTTRPEDDAEHWQWTLSLDPTTGVTMEVSPDLIRAANRVHSDHTPLDLTREAGTILALVPTAGSWEVSVSGGPWGRVLNLGDLFIAEDDRPEEIRVAPTTAAPDCAIHIVTLESTAGTQLRWIP